jgi:hypothetical protein
MAVYINIVKLSIKKVVFNINFKAYLQKNNLAEGGNIKIMLFYINKAMVSIKIVVLNINFRA